MSVENTQAKVPATPNDDAPAQPAPPAEARGAHGGINLPVLWKLKQHHVVRVALLYLGVSWIILEPVHVVFHMLEVPEWANRLVIVVIALGFPLTVIPAWIYAATPATMKPDALQARHSGLRRMNRRLNLAIAAVAVMMVLCFVLYHFWLGSTSSIRSARTHAPASTPVVPGVALPQRSIAVLPFVDIRRHQYGRHRAHRDAFM
jgi:hypothetical protein